MLHALVVPAASDVIGTVKHALTSVTAQAYSDVSDFVSTPAVLVSQFDASLCSSELGTRAVYHVVSYHYGKSPMFA